jgi:cytochrome bd-type quinol oxidase subunit 2
MVYQILVAVGAVVMALTLLLVILTSKKQPRARTRYWDFISIAAVFFGGFALINLLYSAAGTKFALNDTITKIMLISFPAILILFFLMYLALFFLKGGINSTVADDERTEISGTKSARNALLATNLALFIYLGSSQTLNRSALLIVLFSGFVVYLGSIFFYYYFKA